MLFKSSLLAQASGSVGGSTYSHNKGGMYIRNRTIPTNPNSAFQQAVRSIMSSLTSRWGNILTPTQRAQWTAYAEAVPLTNRLGDPRTVSGLNMFVRSNVPIQQAGLATVDDGPLIMNMGEYTEPTYAVAAATDDVDVTFDDTDEWVDENEAAMMVYASCAKSATINFHSGPYRLAGIIEGDSVTPPTTPATINLPFPVEAGQKIFLRAQVVRADGRLSADSKIGSVAT